MDNDKKEAYRAVILSLLLTVLPWIVHLASELFSLGLQQFGLYPMEWRGLVGILTLPLLHEGTDHLISNTPPLFLLIFGLFLFYGKTAWRIMLYLYLVSGLLTWFMGRPDSIHIGASGVVYALAAFHFVSGIIKKEPRQMAFALLVAFLYGGFVWAFFPTLYRYTSVSWEGHLSGLLTGITFAFYFRRSGPKPPAYPYLTDEDETDEDEDPYWKLPPDEEKNNLKK
ncbi:MAG: rhomboid family intramembrane serine protease [Tannerella sp.]|jgi:membrane associated rhomboid family serine protease|nr:rhomboid family intramembrane serine protease [Tannerella sp.]